MTYWLQASNKKEKPDNEEIQNRRPKKGDKVKIHYVGTLEGTGSQFDSTRYRDKPFEFTVGAVGAGQVPCFSPHLWHAVHVEAYVE